MRYWFVVVFFLFLTALSETVLKLTRKLRFPKGSKTPTKACPTTVLVLAPGPAFQSRDLVFPDYIELELHRKTRSVDDLTLISV